MPPCLDDLAIPGTILYGILLRHSRQRHMDKGCSTVGSVFQGFLKKPCENKAVLETWIHDCRGLNRITVKSAMAKEHCPWWP